MKTNLAGHQRYIPQYHFHLYYYSLFSCFFTKIFSMDKSFRMTSFASREAMTTAEPPEPSHAILPAVFLSTSMAFAGYRPGGEAFSVRDTGGKSV